MYLTSQVYSFLRSLILPLDQIDKLMATKGRIIDLGCGEGVLAKYLAKSQKRFVIGVDINKRRLGRSHLTNLKFVQSDIRKFRVEGSIGVILSDVLHHLSYSDQDKLIKKIYQELKKNGRLLIKEIDKSEFLRSKISRFFDFLLYPKDEICYRRSDEFRKFLQKVGFNVKLIRASRLFPGATTLYVCKK